MLDNQLNGIEVLRKITTVVEELENLLEQRYGHLRLIRHFLDNLTEELAATLPEHRPQRNFIKIYEVEVVPNARIVAIGYVVIPVAAPVHVDPESQPAPSTPELPEPVLSPVNSPDPVDPLAEQNQGIAADPEESLADTISQDSYSSCFNPPSHPRED